MNKDLKWPAVAVILVVVVVLAFLAYHDKDVTPVLAGIIAVLGALGYAHVSNKQTEIQQSTAKIEENTNGRIGQLNATIEQQRQDQIAREEQNSRALRDMSDQHRRDMKEMAEKLATMTPPEAVNPASNPGGEGNPSDV